MGQLWPCSIWALMLCQQQSASAQSSSEEDEPFVAEEVRARRDARIDGRLEADAAFLVRFLRHLSQDLLQSSNLLRVETRALSKVGGEVGGDSVFANAATVALVPRLLREDQATDLVMKLSGQSVGSQASWRSRRRKTTARRRPSAATRTAAVLNVTYGRASSAWRQFQL